MAMCGRGKELYSEWKKYADIAGLLEVRAVGGLLAGTRADVKIEITFEEACRRSNDAMWKFMDHYSWCNACTDAAFR